MGIDRTSPLESLRRQVVEGKPIKRQKIRPLKKRRKISQAEQDRCLIRSIAMRKRCDDGRWDSLVSDLIMTRASMRFYRADSKQMYLDLNPQSAIRWMTVEEMHLINVSTEDIESELNRRIDEHPEDTSHGWAYVMRQPNSHGQRGVHKDYDHG